MFSLLRQRLGHACGQSRPLISLSLLRRPGPRTSVFQNAHPPHRLLSQVQVPKRGSPTVEELEKRYKQKATGNMAVLYGLVGANVVIYLTIQSYIAEGKTKRDMTKAANMANRWTVGLNDIREGRWGNAFRANFFHIDTAHIFFNMFSFYFMGSMVARTRGVTAVSHMLPLTLGSAVCSIAAWATFASPNERANGFSGVVSAFVTAAACLEPRATFMIWGIVPCPAWLFCVGYFAYEFYEMQHNQNSPVGHSAHLGGAAFGGLYFLLVLRKARGKAAAEVYNALKTYSTRR